VFYNAGTSQCGSYSSNYDFSDPKIQAGFATDWDLIVRTNGNGVFFYRKADGVGAFGTFDASCRWKQLNAYSGFTLNWSHLVTIGQGILFYKASEGVGALVQFAADGTLTQTGTYVSGELTKDWEQAINTGAGILFYKGDGSGELGTFDATSKYLKTKTYAAGDLPANASLVMPVGH
jgi:hypothetical protein